MKKIIFATLSLLLLSCGQSYEEIETHVKILRHQSAENINLIYKSATNLKIEVMYEAGAAPYTGKSFRNIDYWDMFEDNIKHVFQIRNQPMNISVPKELNQMTLIPSQNKDHWTIEDIEKVVNRYKKESSTSSKAVFHTLFVNGFYKDGSQVKSSVIGINISHSTIIVIFKDVVERLASGHSNESTAKYAEQSTLIHEFGHAIGIVNNGLPMQTAHQDSDHGAHCSNQDCVMYWLNAANQDIGDLVEAYINEGRSILYGPLCLEDIKKY